MLNKLKVILLMIIYEWFVMYKLNYSIGPEIKHSFIL